MMKTKGSYKKNNLSLTSLVDSSWWMSRNCTVGWSFGGAGPFFVCCWPFLLIGRWVGWVGGGCRRSQVKIVFFTSVTDSGSSCCSMVSLGWVGGG